MRIERIMTERGKDRFYTALITFVFSCILVMITIASSNKHERDTGKEEKVIEIEKKVVDLDLKKLDKTTFENMVKTNEDKHQSLYQQIDQNFKLQNQKIDDNFSAQTKMIIDAINKNK